MDANLNRKAFQQDAQAKATHLLARAEEILDLQRHIDEDTRDVLRVAGERMDVLLHDKEHFLHKKAPPGAATKVPMVQQKKELLACFLQACQAQGDTENPFRGHS